MNKLLKKKQAHDKLGMGRSKFDSLVAEGRAPQPVRVDGLKLWCDSELDQWIDEKKERRTSVGGEG